MSAWRLVEAVPATSPAAEPVEANNTSDDRRGGNEGRGQRKFGGGRGQGRGQGRGGRGPNTQFRRFQTLPDEEKTRLLDIAFLKIDRLFDNERLAADTYLRAFFDVEGYLPVAVVCNYALVSNLGIPLPDVIKKLQTSTKYECDVENETFRMKEGWEKWRMPSATGLGLPRYVKIQNNGNNGQRHNNVHHHNHHHNNFGNHHNNHHNNYNNNYNNNHHHNNVNNNNHHNNNNNSNNHNNHNSNNHNNSSANHHGNNNAASAANTANANAHAGNASNSSNNSNNAKSDNNNSNNTNNNNNNNNTNNNNNNNKPRGPPQAVPPASAFPPLNGSGSAPVTPSTPSGPTMANLFH